MNKLFNEIFKSNFMKGVKKFVNSNFVAKFIITIGIWIVVFVPVYVYTGVRFLIDPVGFWQEIALIVAFVFCLGWLQGPFLFFGVALTLFLMFEDI